MGNAVSKYADEFNLKVEIDVAGLTEEQASALKCRLAESKILVADDSAKGQIRLDAATADVDNAIANAIKLERASTDYMVETKAQSGSAKTSVSMSGRGDVNWRKYLSPAILILVAAVVIAWFTWTVVVILSGPKSKGDSYRSNQSRNSGLLPPQPSQPQGEGTWDAEMKKITSNGPVAQS